MLVLLATAIVFVPVVAEKESQLVVSVSEKQFAARVGEPVNWARRGTVQNLGTVDESAKFDFNKKADIVSVLIGPAAQNDFGNYIPGDAMETFTAKKGETVDGAKVSIKGHKVKIKFPADQIIYYVIVNYQMPAPTMTSSVLQNTASNFLSQFTAATNYDQHTTNVVAPISAPDLPADWTYEAFVTEADGSKRQARYYLKDSDGSGGLDEIGVVIPQLSTVDGELAGQLLPSPSKLSNYKFQQVRADNTDLPFGWFFRVSVDAIKEDQYPWGDGPSPYETVWPYFPFSNEGYDDSSSLVVRAIGEPWILSEPVEVAKSIDIAFKYKPQFGLYGDTWPVFVEILFLDGASDTTYQFRLKSDGSVESDEFVVSSVPDVNKWYTITALKTLDLPEGESRLMRLSMSLGAYGGSPGEEIWLDNIMLNTV